MFVGGVAYPRNGMYPIESDKCSANPMSIEQHILDISAGKQLSLSCHRCLINTGIEKINNI